MTFSLPAYTAGRAAHLVVCLASIAAVGVRSPSLAVEPVNLPSSLASVEEREGEASATLG